MPATPATFDTCDGCGDSEKVATIANVRLCRRCLGNAAWGIARLGGSLSAYPKYCEGCGMTCSCARD